MKTLYAVLLAPAALLAGCSSSSSGSTADDEIDIDEGSFTVKAGDEVVYCARIPMPEKFQGRNLALTSWESNIPAPAHHYFMFFDPTPTAGTPPVPCYGDTPIVQAASADLSLFSMGSLLLVAGTGQDSSTNDPQYGMVLQKNGT